MPKGGKFKDITGNRYGRLVAIRRYSHEPNGKSYWLCKCDCGKETIVKIDNLTNGHTKSCGCLSRETASRIKKTHGESKTRLYDIWCNMKARCSYKGCKSFKHYGAKGIKVCDEWADSFESFRDWAMANGYDKTALKGECTIDRINVYGDYEPDNCRWTTLTEQALNRTDSVYVTAFGKTKTIKEWSDETKIKYGTLRRRIVNGWKPEEALTREVRNGRRN